MPSPSCFLIPACIFPCFIAQVHPLTQCTMPRIRRSSFMTGALSPWCALAMGLVFALWGSFESIIPTYAIGLQVGGRSLSCVSASLFLWLGPIMDQPECCAIGIHLPAAAQRSTSAVAAPESTSMAQESSSGECVFARPALQGRHVSCKVCKLSATGPQLSTFLLRLAISGALRCCLFVSVWPLRQQRVLS